MEDFSPELSSENLEEFLAKDPAFVDYFNTFLSLPCFPERIFYNKDLDLLEQFSQKLVKNENDDVQISSRPLKQGSQRIKHDSSIAAVCISYCVTVLDKECGFVWLKEYRLAEFLKSNLYAEYKLSKVLSAAQALYIGVIKDDVYRAKGCDLESFKKKLERSIRLPPGFTKHCENPSETNTESTELTLTTAGFSNNGPNAIKKIFSDVTPGDVIGNDTITNCYVSGSVVKANDVSPNDVMDGDTKEIHNDVKYRRCFCEESRMSNKSLEGSKDEKFGSEENSSTVQKLKDGWYETDYDTLLSRQEQVKKGSEKIIDCKDASNVIAAVPGCNMGNMEAENDVEITIQLEHEQHNLPEKINKQISKQNSALDVRLSDTHKLSFGFHKLATADRECDNASSKIPEPRQEHSTQNPVNREGDFVEEKAEEKLKPEEEEKHFDLSTKQGMDQLKEFLANTKGETLFSFWLQVELWKSVTGVEDKTKVLQKMKEMFLRNGSPLELPGAMKRHVKVFAEDLSEAQRIIAHPLLTYWCPRFTLHQLKTHNFASLKHQVVASDSSSDDVTAMAWSDVVPKSNGLSIRHINTSPRLVRPQSSTPRVAKAKERKTHVRSKSAFPRIITTPCHTNAGKKQLELYAVSPPPQYGYQKRTVEAFPPPSDQDYLSPVRLVINPLARPSSSLRSAWSQRSEEKPRSIQPHSEEPPNSFFHPETLLDALMYNSETGCFFKEFVNKQNNKLWLNCLSFWHALMEYSAYFDGDTLNPVLVTNKAQWIYARFIASGSICDVQLGWKRQREVGEKLEPAYEELFDVVEEHVLACLKEPWESLCRNERREYDMVPKKETVRYLEVDLKASKDQHNSFGHMAEFESHEEGEKDRGKYSIEEANHPLPTAKDGVSFESIIKDGVQLEGFQKFLEKIGPNGVMDLMAWTDMETFQRIPRTMQDKRNKKAKEIRNGYLNSKFFFGSESPATKEAQNLILSMNGSSEIKERPSTSLISECQKYVRCRIERRWLTLYKESQEYRDRLSPKHNVSDVVEDIMLRRRLQRSEAAWRVLNSRWVSSSRDIVALRHTLNNPESCLAFRKFVALKGDTYENDVLFWIEVQKYKDLCHRHASEKCIKKKVQAITDCFLTSSIPPDLQIDVPIEMAEKLMERITSRNPSIGPYLFREVQMTVFRVLFNMWKEFCSFRSTMKDGSLLEVLEKKLLQHRIEVRQKREASERKKLAKQEAEKKRKEKEEKERKDLKSVEQLVSLMTETGSWEHEEEDVVLWRYSKHVAGSETVRKKTSAQEEMTSVRTLTNQRSLVTKSTNNITASTNTGKDPTAVSEFSKSHRGRDSAIAESLLSNQSKGTQKTKKSANLLIPKFKHSVSGGQARSKEVALKSSDGKEKTVMSRDTNLSEKFTSLQNRRRKEFKNLPDTKISNFLQKRWVRGMPIKDTRDKDSGIESPRFNDPVNNLTAVRTNKCQKMSSTSVMPFVSESQGRNRSPVALTSELLKDFTNSPEGAPLETPLTLVRINRSPSLSVLQETKNKTLTQERGRNSLRYKREKRKKDVQDFVPDVIVN